MRVLRSLTSPQTEYRHLTTSTRVSYFGRGGAPNPNPGNFPSSPRLAHLRKTPHTPHPTEMSTPDSVSDSDSDNDTEIQTLHGARNFYVWKATVKKHLASLDLWTITSGATPRPAGGSSSTTAAQTAWDDSSLLARYFLARHMAPAVSALMEPHATAPALWTALGARYHEHAPADLLRALDAIRALRYVTEHGTFREHLAAFEARWEDLRLRCEDAEPLVAGAAVSLRMALCGVVGSDEAKRTFLVASLPSEVVVFVEELEAETEGGGEGVDGDGDAGELDYEAVRRAVLAYCAWEDGLSVLRVG